VGYLWSQSSRNLKKKCKGNGEHNVHKSGQKNFLSKKQGAEKFADRLAAAGITF